MGIGERGARISHSQLPLQYSSQPSIEAPLFPSNNDVRIIMRKKKENPVRHAQPPSNIPTRVSAIHRPNSTASFNSLASVGLENVSWRNSSCGAATEIERGRRRTYIEDNKSMQLEEMRKEEAELLENGLRVAERLVAWYRERREAAAKKQRLVSQAGHVIVESAVQEQQLNYLRAHLTELNRRVLAVMERSEKGFPVSSNSQGSRTNGAAVVSEDAQIQWLKRQNKSLNLQLADKIKELEELRRTREPRPVSLHRPSAFVKPAPICQNFHSPQSSNSPIPIKVYDTLM